VRTVEFSALGYNGTALALGARRIPRLNQLSFWFVRVSVIPSEPTIRVTIHTPIG
jgi:hypothetical protein